MILLSEMEIFLPNWSWARQPLSSARSTLLYPFQMLNAKQGSSNSHLLTSFGMTRPGLNPRPPDYEADALLIEPTI